MSLPTAFLLLSAGLILLLGSAFTITSWREKEGRAGRRSLVLTIVFSGMLVSAAALPQPLQMGLMIILLVIILALIILFFFPDGEEIDLPHGPTRRVDERTIPFSRFRLEPGSAAHRAYYREYPHQRKPDRTTRRFPGLLSSGAKLTDPYTSAGAKGSFFLTEAVREAVDGPTAPQKHHGSPEEMSRWVKQLAGFWGALDTGITRLHPTHIYSRIGRGTGEYGSRISLDHDYAVAFTVEMDHRLTRTAPHPTLTMESGKQYVEAARVAIQLAAALRNLGFQARAHIDGNYRVIAPLVARDAGLGEIGRMGLLMTPRQGPRVRLGVVTTDLPLKTDSSPGDRSLIAFCQICKKCAVNCPSRSIPRGGRLEKNGSLRWKINADTCYRYWTASGTDCGRCLAVCPYAHPDNWAHNLVRWGIRRSAGFRRAALILDDLLYGKEPEPLNSPFSRPPRVPED